MCHHKYFGWDGRSTLVPDVAQQQQQQQRQTKRHKQQQRQQQNKNNISSYLMNLLTQVTKKGMATIEKYPNSFSRNIDFLNYF